LIFIDAAKSQSIKFFEKFKYFLKDNGTIITDNLKFHGNVGKSSEIESKNLRSLVGKIENYIEFLKNNPEFETKFYNVGDGLSVSVKKDEKK
jgi:predicted O-methyltransferase YrrM